MSDLENLSGLDSLISDNTEVTSEDLTGIESLISTDTKESPIVVDETQTVEYFPAPGKARIYGTGEDPEWEQSLRDAPFQLNADTGLYEVNSILANDPNYKDLLPLLSLRADTKNKLEAIKKEAYQLISEDPLNVDKYKEDYTNKAIELLNQVSPQAQALLSNVPTVDNRSTGEKFSNAVEQGLNHFLYNEAHQGDYAKTFASSMLEKGKDIIPFIDPDIKNIPLTVPYQPVDINSDWESGVESISRSVAEIASTMLAAGGGAAIGAGAGSVLPGLGTAVGAGIGGTTGTATASAMTANAMYGETLYNSYQQYLAEGLDETEAMMRAITDATVEGGIEFGSGMLGAGIAKLAKMGVPISKVVKAATKLAKSGGLKKTEAGYEVTKEGVKSLRKSIKDIAKSAGIVIGGGAVTEGGEELAQGTWEAGRHRKEGQSWVQAITEKAPDIAQQALWGGIGGAIGIGGARAVTKGVEFAGTKISNKLEESAIKKGEDAETINAAVEVSLVEGQEELAKFEEDQSKKEPTTKTTTTVGTVTPIGDSYGTEVQGNEEVDAQGDTVLTDKSEIKFHKVSVNEELDTQNNDSEPIYNEPEETGEQLKQLNTTRSEIAKANDIDNNEIENTIQGSVSDNGYYASDTSPVEGTGLAQKDEVPSTPETAKNNIAVHHEETVKAMDVLGIKYAARVPLTELIMDLPSPTEDEYYIYYVINNEDGSTSRYRVAKYRDDIPVGRVVRIQQIEDEEDSFGNKLLSPVKFEDVSTGNNYKVVFLRPDASVFTDTVSGRWLLRFYTPVLDNNSKSAAQPAPAAPQTPTTAQAPATPTVSNEEVSSIHKYYGVKNFVESVGSAVTDKLGNAYKLVVKGELTDKEKILQGISTTVRGYVRPLVNNVIRISSSRDYHTILHETAHHMVAKLDILKQNLSDDNIKKLLKKEHRRLEKSHPEHKLNEAAYKKKHQDITEEYFNDLFAAYGTDTFTPNNEVIDLINNALYQLNKKTGVDNTAQFDLMRQQFVDYNLIRARVDGALTLANNNMSAVERLQRGKFDTKNLTNKQVSRIQRWLEKTKEFPSKVVTTLFNENYQLEKDAKRVGTFETLVKSQQALKTTNRIAEAFTTGTGVSFNKGSLHKLNNLKNLTRIYLDTKALGDGYTNKLRSLLWAKQTIGESTGNQRKADNLLQLSKNLGYNTWLDARKDLKFLSMFCQTSLFQGLQVTPDVITKANNQQKAIASAPVLDEDSSAHSVKTDVASMNFNDKNLLSRLNAMVQYIQAEANKHSIDKYTGKVDVHKKNDYIQENYILDKAGEVNTGLPLSDALEIYTTLQSDPKIAELESLENDVRNLFNALDNLMSDGSVAGAMRIMQAKHGVGAWYIPLLRFIDEGEELAVGVSSDGNTLRFRDGSTREVLDIFSSINHSINDVANRVTRDQAIEYMLSLKDFPIFAQYMREIPADSVAVNASLMEIANRTIESINAKFLQAKRRGEPLPANREKALNDWKDYFTKIKDDLSKGNAIKEDDRIQIFVDADPSKSNNNVIQRLEADGNVHYYLLHDNLYNFIYKQGKSLFNIASIDQYVKDHIAWAYKLNTFLNALQRASFTSLNAAFQVANVLRDTGDVAFKSSDKDTVVSGFIGFIPRYVNHFWGLSKLAGSLTTEYGREEFKMLTTLFGGAEQTQYKDGDYTTSYLDYKYNKNGKIVRGGILGILDEIATAAGMTDLGSRVLAVKRKAKQLGIDPYEINATYDDYLSLELPKRLLKKYISDSDIERIFGKDKANVWKDLSNNEFVPFVPEEFEKSQLDSLLKWDKSEIDNKVSPQLRTELQEIYDNCTIDFSKGTLTTRTLGKAYLFANARLQGGYQYFRYMGNKKKAAAGSVSFLITAGIMAGVLGWEDDKPNYKEDVLKGINIKPLGIKLPLQTFPMMFYRLGVHIGYDVKSLFGKDSRYNTSLASEAASILWDNTAGAMEQPSGLYGVTLTTPAFLLTGQNLSFSDTSKYHEFNYFRKQKAGANVDTLTKSMDTEVSRSISKWLVDNGVSYKYSTHEIDRYLRTIFGNSLHQMEGLLGIKTILDDKDNNIGWLDYTNDQIKAFMESITKPLTIKDIPHSEDSDYLEQLEALQMSLYDRFTGQIGANKKDRVTPEMLPEEDKLKYQKHYDNAILSKHANELLQVIQRTASRIDKDKVGGEKAFSELSVMYKDMAYKFREIIDKHNGNLDESLGLLDTLSGSEIQESEQLLKENKEAEKEPNILVKGIDAIANAISTNSEAQEPESSSKEQRQHPVTSFVETSYVNEEDAFSSIKDGRFGPNHLTNYDLIEFTKYISGGKRETPTKDKTGTFVEYSYKANPNFTKLSKTNPVVKDFVAEDIADTKKDSYVNAYKELIKQPWFKQEYKKFTYNKYNASKDIPSIFADNDAIQQMGYSIKNHAGSYTKIISNIKNPSTDARQYLRQMYDAVENAPNKWVSSAHERHLVEYYLFSTYLKHLQEKNLDYDIGALQREAEDYKLLSGADSRNPVKKKNSDGKYVLKSADEVDKEVWGE